MTVSVIIPTYNGAHKILTAIRAVASQQLQPDEILVVIDGSTDNTDEVIRSAGQELKRLRVIRQNNQGRAAVRNTGAAHATMDLLVFLDDDMKPEPDWLGIHLRHHQSSPGSILTASAVDLPVTDGPDYQKYRSALSAHWANDLRRFDGHPLPKDKVFITAANFSIPRQLFNTIGGFDSILNDGEDYDFAVRATRLRIPIHYNSAACAWHCERFTCAYSIKRTRGYYEAGRILLQARPEIYEPIFSHRKTMNQSFKARLFKVFCDRFWIDSIDRDAWTWLPRKLRYKLYDLVLTANGIYFPEKVHI